MKKKNYILVTILMILMLVSTSCATTKKNDSEKYEFPNFDEVSRETDEFGNITSKNKRGEIVFYYDIENDTVTIPRWYWIKLLTYGLDTGGLEVQ